MLDLERDLAAHSRRDDRSATRAGRWALIAAIVAVVGLMSTQPPRFYMSPFRESQTAISVRSMRQEGGGPATYATPIFGRPWEIPLEWGSFQWLVTKIPAGLSSEDGAGKGISVVFYFLCPLAIWALCREIGLPRGLSIWSAGLWALAPVYLAYSTAYMIESFALFLALAHIWLGLRWVRSASLWSGGGCLVAGILAAMTKGTTWAPAACFLAGGMLLDPKWSRRVSSPVPSRTIRIAWVAVCLLISFAAGIIWVRYSDLIKARNPLAIGLTSRNLSSWVYGTWEQKLSPQVWSVILVKEALLSLGPLGLILPFAVFLPLVRKTHPVLLVGRGIALSLGAFLVAPAVFTNLHYRHQYYVYANGVYLVIAAALYLNSIRSHRSLVFLLYALPVSAVVTSFSFIHLQRSIRNGVDEHIITTLAKLAPNQCVVFCGFDWSAYTPYYAHQRALFVPLELSQDLIATVLEKNRGVDMGAVVWMGDETQRSSEIFRSQLLQSPSPPREIWPHVWISLPAAERAALGTDFKADNTTKRLIEIQAEIPPREKRADGIVYHSVQIANLWRRSASILRCGVKRGNELFFFDSSEGILWRFSGYFESNGPA